MNMLALMKKEHEEADEKTSAFSSWRQPSETKPSVYDKFGLIEQGYETVRYDHFHRDEVKEDKISEKPEEKKETVNSNDADPEQKNALKK